MKVAILARYPLHLLPGFEHRVDAKENQATWLPQLARRFSEAEGLDIHWLTLSRTVDHPEQVVSHGQTFHVLPMAKPGNRLPTLFRDDRQQIKLCLEKIRPDVVHGWGSEDVYGLAAVAFGGQSIISMQGILSHLLLVNPRFGRMNSTRENLKSLRFMWSPYLIALTLIELYILMRAKTVTVESEWGAALLRRRRPSLKPEVIEYGGDDRYFSTAWQPDPERPRVIFIGTTGPRKGLQDLIEAFADPALAGVELVVVGSGGEWAAELCRKSTPNVRWTGHVPSEEIPGLLAGAWCLALPTRADTSPNVVKEARIIGMPVVTSPNGGQNAYIEQGRNGFIVENRDIPALVKALVTITGDFDRCRAMGAWKHAEQRELLSPRRTAEAFIALYRRLFSSPSALR